MRSAVYDYSKRKPVERYPVYTAVYLMSFLVKIPSNDIALHQCKTVFSMYIDKAIEYYEV